MTQEKMISIEFTAKELEALQSLCATADLVKISEKSMPGIAGVFKKVYEWRVEFDLSLTKVVDR